mmetsp:Transcript_675/g.869  ORF Transcript_675/g.869 Transcript_675/m.869 type:complete len:219 (-) Transcript_675:217-873(-)
MTTKLRDEDELEGALLPPPPPAFVPVATPIDDPLTTTPSETIAVSAAVPIQRFEYDQETIMNDNVPGSSGTETVPFSDNTAREATHIPTYDDNSASAKQRANTVAAKIGTIQGRISADEEQTELDKARREIYPIQYKEKNAFKKANEEAKRRDREGVQIQEDKWFQGNGESNNVDKTDNDANTYFKKPSGGYEVREYETKEYATTDYEISEYKSVYDN